MYLLLTLSSRFDNHLAEIRQLDAEFFNYFKDNWVSCKKLWALHAQKGVVHLGNLTNNRVENAHGRLKKHTHPRDRLVVAVQKVWRYLQVSMRDWQSQTSMGCVRRMLKNKDPFIAGIVGRLTVYASDKVRRHLKNRIVGLPYTSLRNFKVRNISLTTLFAVLC